MSTNNRPPDGICLDCGVTTRPFLRPRFLDFEARWLPPASLCTSCIEKREEMAKTRKAQEAIDEAFRNSRMSASLRQRTFENFVPASTTHKAYEIARSFRPHEGSLLFSGACGVGKTHLAAAIANREIGKIPTLFISCPEFLLDLRDGMSRGNKDYFALFDLARRVPLLILDDIGSEKPSEWVRETLFVLINHRCEHLLSTLFTTNCSLEELAERLGERTASRIIGICRCIQMDGPDRRIRRRKKSIEEAHV